MKKTTRFQRWREMQKHDCIAKIHPRGQISVDKPPDIKCNNCPRYWMAKEERAYVDIVHKWWVYILVDPRTL